jgi:DNA-binding NarL/FixJ family response regulator
MGNPVTVLIADGHEMMRESLSLLLGSEPGVRVVGVASEGQSAVALAAATRPQVVILDIGLPKLDGVVAGQQIRTAAQGTGLVLISAHDRARYLKEFLKDDPAGKAYLLTSSLNSTRDLIRTIVDIAAGRTVLDPAMVSKLTTSQHVSLGSNLRGLTQRELQVLALMAKAHSNKSVAEVLFIQPRTVEHHISSILSKLGSQSEGEYHGRVRAVLTYLEAIGHLPLRSEYAPEPGTNGQSAPAVAPTAAAASAAAANAGQPALNGTRAVPSFREPSFRDPFQKREYFTPLQGRVA